ncbi:HEAT repeat domain-containing protein [Dyadobacter sandarakinus]|uniref:HEAT repeat domain-containing protein n=1 Tax=Dyadobacter sandarakinus TaxID=2747268 RepID=A0ABX7I4X0_9BACT|nr:HEAT repeat domain-containing protein [Dyadobacter sandarakinus]QRR01127.1 HEAT repeat domain-containing protein [Dyadobacter sandarakinus]
MKEDIEELLTKYYEGETTVEEERELKRFFQNEPIPMHLQSHAAQFVYFTDARNEHPSRTFSNELALLLDPPRQTPVRRFGSWLIRIAAGFALLLVGFAGGWFVKNNRGQAADGVHAPASAIRNVLAFEQVSKTSASERIQAVNQAYGLTQADQQITQTLTNTLNFDPNVNVRLAACQALLHFQNEPGVKEALMQSLSIQTDPNVQISLIEALVSIKEKRAADQFRQIMHNKEVLEAVRSRAEFGLGELDAADV